MNSQFAFLDVPDIDVSGAALFISLWLLVPLVASVVLYLFTNLYRVSLKHYILIPIWVLHGAVIIISYAASMQEDSPDGSLGLAGPAFWASIGLAVLYLILLIATVVMAMRVLVKKQLKTAKK